MYVCVCHALTDRDVREAGTQGAMSHDQVFAHFGVQSRCGRCTGTMCRMLEGCDCPHAAANGGGKGSPCQAEQAEHHCH